MMPQPSPDTASKTYVPALTPESSEPQIVRGTIEETLQAVSEKLEQLNGSSTEIKEEQIDELAKLLSVCASAIENSSTETITPGAITVVAETIRNIQTTLLSLGGKSLDRKCQHAMQPTYDSVVISQIDRIRNEILPKSLFADKLN